MRAIQDTSPATLFAAALHHLGLAVQSDLERAGIRIADNRRGPPLAARSDSTEHRKPAPSSVRPGVRAMCDDGSALLSSGPA